MVMSLKETGKMTEFMDNASLTIKMATILSEIIKMVKEKVQGHIFLVLMTKFKVNGMGMIFVQENYFTQMAKFMRAKFIKVNEMDGENTLI